MIEEVKALLHILSPQEAKVIDFVYLREDKLTIKETAEILKTSISSVHAAEQSAIKKLEKALQKAKQEESE